jgi:hypothetical protein
MAFLDIEQVSFCGEACAFAKVEIFDYIRKRKLEKMRVFTLIVLLLGIGLGAPFAQAPDTLERSPSIEAYTSYCTFMAPDEENYVELYYTVNGQSINYARQENGQLQGTLNVTYMFLNQDTVVAFDKFQLLTPQTDSISNIDFDILDQRRTSLPPGQYRLKVSLTDAQDTTNRATFDMPVTMRYRTDTVQISGIELVDRYEEQSGETSRFTKHGYDIYPMVINFFPTDKKKVTFYTEVYNTQKVVSDDQKFLVQYSIRKSNSQEVVNNLKRFVKKEPSKVNVVFGTIDIEDLSSGNYELAVEVRSPDNQLLTEKRLFFQRSNKTDVKSRLAQLQQVDIEDTFVDTIRGDRLD